MELHILGSGCPAPTPDRFGSAFILDAGSDLIMVDCGPATTWKMARMGIRTTQVHHLFLTHHHFDHNSDFPTFALTRWDQSTGGEPPLIVYGPPPTRSFVDKLMGKEGAFFPDWDSRIKHPASHWCHEARGGTLPRPAPAFEVKEAKSGDSYRADSWTVHTQSVQHVEPYLKSLAFRFETSAGSVVFAGDCADCPDLRDFATGADTLVAACTHFGPSETDPAISEVITGSSDTAEIAAEADVNTLVLTHANSRFAQPETQKKVIAEIRETFDGAVFFPEELTTVAL